MLFNNWPRQRIHPSPLISNHHLLHFLVSSLICFILIPASLNARTLSVWVHSHTHTDIHRYSTRLTLFSLSSIDSLRPRVCVFFTLVTESLCLTHEGSASLCPGGAVLSLPLLLPLFVVLTACGAPLSQAHKMDKEESLVSLV